MTTTYLSQVEIDRLFREHYGPELVDPAFACPNCGERQMDKLAWQHDGEYIKCATCGFCYDPEA